MPLTSDEAQIRRYLLGLSSSEERAAIEQRFFQDDVWFEQIQAAEAEMIRDYVRDQLTPEDRRHFEANCRRNPGLQAKIETERRFLAALPPSLVDRVRGYFTLPRLSFALTAATAMASLSVAAWLAHENSGLRGDVARFQQAAGKASSSRTPVFASFLLSPGVLRGAGEEQRRLTVPQGVGEVRLQLEYPQASPDKHFRVLVRAVGGAEAASERANVTRPDTLSVMIPATALPTNDYILALQIQRSDGQYETVESYSFGVIQK